MLAAINIAGCNFPEGKEDAEAFALVHRCSKENLNNMVLVVEDKTMYLVSRQRDGRTDLARGNLGRKE